MTTTLIANGTVVSAEGAVAQDVLIDGERIAALLPSASSSSASSATVVADRVIDAAGKYVIPGGVDVHTHMEVPFGVTFSSDTFASGTQAAAWGGTTTIVDFAVQRKGERVLEGLEAWHAKAAGQCAIDYGFHMIVGDVTDESLSLLDRLADEGITSVKLFMAYPGVYYSDDGEILRMMQTAAANGTMVMVHAENGPAIDVLVRQALERGDTSPINHGLTRPVALEEEATFRSIKLAEVAGCPVYVVHMSAGAAVARVAEARSAGANVFGETCPQYLYLTLEDHLGAPGFEGAKWACSTPLRSRHEHHQDDLWRALRLNDLQVVSTDHCPFCFKEQKELGIGDFSKIPNGIGTVEHRMDLLYQGVVDGHISLPRWVDVACTTPARLFGLYPRKGTIAPGSDADVVVYDPSATTTLGGATHHMNIDHSAYEGIKIQGKVDTVLSRGQIVVESDQFVGSPTHGRYQPRTLSDLLL
ncbi:MAG TPA: dihydropyrimidinase [Acidimicrobiales bacterium]|nr:dihydropyrimidinase [Acidimicrobiales bacterium]